MQTVDSKKKFHLISGLPRAGSTLLSSILKQNPRFSAGISDPLHSFVHSIIRDINSNAGMDAQVSVERRRQILIDLFSSFYKDHPPVCFNTNRAWTADTSLLKDLFGDFKMIVCVRSVPWILNSFELLQRRNPLTIKPLYHHQDLGTVHERCQMLMGEMPNFGGYVLSPLLNLQQAVWCEERNNLCFVEYDALVNYPLQTMQRVYQFLEEPWFAHDFNNVADSYDEFDQQAKIQGLHTVRSVVKPTQSPQLLPPSLWERYAAYDFWQANFEQRRNLLWLDTATVSNIAAPRPAAFRPPTGRQL